MRVVEPVEILYLTLMHRWERAAPPDKHAALLDGEDARNTQTARLRYVLEKIAAGTPATAERVYSTLARHTRRNDGESYVSRKSGWMQQPEALSCGWHVEACTNLDQKLNVVSALSHLGLSGAFVQAVADFVSHKSIERFLPTEADEPESMARVRKWEAANGGS